MGKKKQHKHHLHLSGDMKIVDVDRWLRQQLEPSVFGDTMNRSEFGSLKFEGVRSDYSVGNAHWKHIKEILETELSWILFPATVQLQINFESCANTLGLLRPLPFSFVKMTQNFSFAIPKKTLLSSFSISLMICLVMIISCSNSHYLL